MPETKLMRADRRRLWKRNKNPRWVGGYPSLWELLAPNGSLLLQWRPWKGMTLLAAYLARSIPGGREVGRYSVEEEMMKRRQVADPTAMKKPQADTSTVMLAGVPTLLEHLAHTSYDDGTARKLGEVRIRVEGLVWAVQCTCHDTQCFFSASAPKIDDALSLAALMLACEDCPWEPAHWLIGKKSKK